MSSQERKELRYQRRKAKRIAKKEQFRQQYNDFDTVFSYGNLYHSYKMSRRNVAWKSSVQKYISKAPINVLLTHYLLHNDKFKSQGFYEFDIMERGKKRHIRSVSISERVVQRCLCDYSLVPVLSRTFIYDNGASMKNKGYTFSSNRLQQHLREHYRKHGQDGYILLFDFSKFFDNISHQLAKQTISNELSDSRLLKLSYHFIECFGDIGLGLGSQISQILALASANKLDHFVKEKLKIRGYGRYMDDGYLIHHSKEYLHKCLKSIKQICDELGIILNQKKTQIIKLRRGFTFLKAKYYLLPSGRVVKKLTRTSIVKMRRKLKAFVSKISQGIMTDKDVYQSWQSWRAYASTFNSYLTVKNLGKLFNELYPNILT